MNVKQLTYNYKKGVKNTQLISLNKIRDSFDKKHYEGLGYEINFTLEEFKEVYPNINCNNIYFHNGLFPCTVYFDIDKLIYKELWFNGVELITLFENDSQTELKKIIDSFESLYTNKKWCTLLTSSEGRFRFYMLGYAVKNHIIEQEKLYKVFIDVYTHTDFGIDELSKSTINEIIKSKTKKEKQDTANKIENFNDLVTVYRGGIK